MYIAELPKDVQTIIRYALTQRHIEDYGYYPNDKEEMNFLIGCVKDGMDSKIDDIIYLFENEE